MGGAKMVKVTGGRVEAAAAWARKHGFSHRRLPCRCGHPPHEAQCPAAEGCWCDTFGAATELRIYGLRGSWREKFEREVLA